ncbi:transglycosylase SLT domain-containing protein [Campylobacter sp. RM12640]|uniref:transglycosylase SLT domain-containing protein n=1 Tax=unclassified Campylobacter TaxID=2593542 RepID=UPI001D9445D8|nr:transglycosylase SLT domain-containing protein [Campylobacter sp. RM12642]MBZ7982449.1 transglycosylase SLT domain-containing protein [Campylobacter sp. RM12640]MBZ7989954.1 transglycosylase SLT domain-containing protein [Campylobacter sp. RM12635]MBZ8008233.1 transglycosylase SLT domain-containing protein [Campylobacter sp. RM9334]
MVDIALIEQCKNPNVPTEIIQKIILIESNNNQFAINVNGIGSFILKTKEEAKEKINYYLSKNASVDIGLMQFNSNNLKLKAFSSYSVDDLLDTCKNIKAGSDVFYLAYESTDKNLSEKERINQALSVYNTGNITNGFLNGYVAKYDSNLNIKNINEEARKSNTKINIAFNLFNLETLKNEKAQ